MILVTGATGFVGTNLVRELVRRGESVRILCRASSNLEGLVDLPIEQFIGDLLDQQSLQKAIKNCRQVYHVASLIEMSPYKRNELYDVNILGTEMVMRAALDEGVDRLVYTSSAVTLGYSTQEDPVTEESQYNFGWLENPYIESKKRAEDVVLAYSKRGVPAVIVNPGYIFGSWDKNPKLNKILILAAQSKLKFYFGGGLSVVDVADVVQGHLLAMEKGDVGERYIISNENLTYKDFMTLANQLTGKPPPCVKLPTWLMVMMGRLAETYGRFAQVEAPLSSSMARLYDVHHYMSSKKAIQELGYKPKSLKESLKLTLDWLEKHHYIQ